MFKSHGDIIRAWPSLKLYAKDIRVAENTAKGMRSRDSISAVHWPLVVKNARKRKIAGVTTDLLADLRRKTRRRRLASTTGPAAHRAQVQVGQVR